MKTVKIAKETLYFSDLVGKVLLEVKRLPYDQKDIISWYKSRLDGEALLFVCDDGEYIMYHGRDCCESVDLIDGFEDLQGIVGAKILGAEEESSEAPQGVESITESEHESYTWTFYNIQTEKGFATLRWFGSSNGYYSESVDFYKVVSEAI